MVRCTKGCLKKTLGSASLKYGERITVLTEIENVLNSRQLTYVYEDKIEEPLTPSLLMLGRRLLSNGTVKESAAGQSQSQLRSPRELRISSCFWNIFQADAKGST